MSKEMPGEVGRFDCGKHGATVKHSYSTDLGLWYMELESIDYTGRSQFRWAYHAFKREDLPLAEGQHRDFRLVAFCKEEGENEFPSSV